MTNQLAGKLIVSCQADPGDAFHGMMDRFARAAVEGGAAGIRANGVHDVRAIRSAVNVPIIGIEKVMHADGGILITPSFETAQALVEAGATMIALDCTKRGERLGALHRLRRIKTELGVPVLADIATVEEAQTAEKAGADFILPTLRGYTADTLHVSRFDPRFIEELVRSVSVPVIAEGRVDTPDLARQAIRAGAFAVVVGTAITRPHVVVRKFANAVRCGEFHILGIDLGGTSTKSGLVSSSGDLTAEETVPTPAKSGRGGLLKHLEEAALRGLARAATEVAAIGIGTAGWVNPATGRVVYATENLPGWTGTGIGEAIQAATGLPVFVENDANALAVGEKHFGVAKSFDDFVCITLGTGVGGGCYIGGRLNHGTHFFANAFGHMCIEPNGRSCSCGKRGCLEAYTNAAALLGYSGGGYPDAAAVIAAANDRQPDAVQAIETLALYLAKGCSLLVQLLDPEALILSGGLAENNPLLVLRLKNNLAQVVPVWEQRNLQVLTSNAGYYAGVIGAAAVAMQGRDTLIPAHGTR